MGVRGPLKDMAAVERNYLELVGQTLGDYKIETWLGEGAHVHAFMAHHVETGQRVAIKVLKSSYAATPELLQRFEREAKAVVGLDHPHLVKVYSYARQRDIFYLVEQFFHGGSLLDRLKANPGPMPLDFVLRTLEDIAAGLDFAHAQGLIHRDIKPENVLYTAEGRAALSDLGITKTKNAEHARSKAGLEQGNPLYMAPEEWQGREPDARTDIYALGVLLFEMLTGELPFERPTSLMFVHLQHLMTSPKSLMEIRRDLPPALEPVLAKAMEKDRDLRYNSAGELAAAFREALTAPAARPEPIRLADTGTIPKGIFQMATKVAPAEAPKTPLAESFKADAAPAASTPTPAPAATPIQLHDDALKRPVSPLPTLIILALGIGLLWIVMRMLRDQKA